MQRARSLRHVSLHPLWAPVAAGRTSSSDATRIAPALSSRARAIPLRDVYRAPRASVNETALFCAIPANDGLTSCRLDGPRNRVQPNVPHGVTVAATDP